MKWKRTEFGLAVVVSAMMPSMAVAADRIANLPTAPVSQSATALTNQFSNWSGQWTNLTVKTACPPWGCYSYSGEIYIYDQRSVPASRREFLESFGKARELQRLREKFNRTPTATYRVSLLATNASK